MGAKLLTAVMCFVGFATCASADITWTLNDVTFSNGNKVTGSFTTNNSVNTIESFSLVVTGPTLGADFTVTQMSSAYLPGEIGMANSNWSEYVDLYLSSNLTSAAGIVSIASGYDCTGCGTLIIHPDTELIGIDPPSTPEPASALLFGTGLIGIAGVLRRRSAARQVLTAS